MGLFESFLDYLRDAAPGGSLNPQLPEGARTLGGLFGADPRPHQRAADAFLRGTVDTGSISGGVQAAIPYQKDMLADFFGAGIIAGPMAKTANFDLLEKAKQMLGEGKAEDDIYKETQWWLGHPDGVPRFEIDDSVAKFDNESKLPASFIEDGFYEQWSLQDVLNHNELYKAYPTTGEIQSSFSKFNDGTKGAYNPGNDWIRYDDATYKMPAYSREGRKEIERIDQEFIDYRTKDGSFADEGTEEILKRLTAAQKKYRDGNRLNGAANSTTLHEVQHAIQGRENLSKGGDSENILRRMSREVMQAQDNVKRYNEKMSEISKQMDLIKEEFYSYPRELQEPMKNKLAELKAEYDSLMSRKLNLAEKAYIDPLDMKEQAYNEYRRLAGEAEARLVQDRMNMNMQQRLANPFYKGYDVPLEQQIVRRGLF